MASIQAAQAASINSLTLNPAAKKDSDGDGDKSGSTAKTGGVGPAVILSLSNTKVGDAAKGDPDGDGH